MSRSTDRRVVVVTGAASPLGRALARRFAERDAVVILADRDPGSVEAPAGAPTGVSGSMTVLPLDVTDPEQSQAVVDRVVADHGRLDIWINNNAVVRAGPAASLGRGDWDESLAITVTGSFFCAQAAGRRMLQQGWGVIVNVASVDAFGVVEGRVAHSVAQAGLVMLTQALGVEWASRGVRVVGVAPGVLAGDAAPRATSTRRIPLGRPGSVDEVAEAVLFLASEEATSIVGETLRVDGGWTAYQLF